MSLPNGRNREPEEKTVTADVVGGEAVEYTSAKHTIVASHRELFDLIRTPAENLIAQLALPTPT